MTKGKEQKTVLLKLNKPGMSFQVKGESFDEDGNRYLSPAGETKVRRGKVVDTIVNYWKWPQGVNEIVIDLGTAAGNQLFNFLINLKARIVSGPGDKRVLGFYLVDVAAEKAAIVEKIRRGHTIASRVKALVGPITEAENNIDTLISVGRALNIQEAYADSPEPIILWNDITRLGAGSYEFVETVIDDMEEAANQSLYDTAIRQGVLAVVSGRVLLRTSASEDGTDIGIVVSVKKLLTGSTEASLELQKTVKAAIKSFS